LGWSFADSADGAVNLTLLEDDAGSYADPTAGEYSTVTADGTITPGFRGVPDPQNLSATAGLKNIELNWTNPKNTSKFKEIVVYASPNSQWSSKVEIGRTLGTQFFHDASTAADPIASGDQRYYWVRAVAYGTGSGSFVESDRNPDNDTSTINAVCGRVNWVDVAGSTNAPANNATVGATFGTDVDDGAGNIVTFTNVENSVLAQEILQVEVEAGQVLDLESGLDVDIQNLGDVAIYVSDNSGILQGNIDTVSTSLSNLELTVVDLTSGVSDVYISTTAPVAGVGGVPDPIPTFSRWYDSDDNNHPYYWTSSAWVSLEDPRIGSNASSITSLTSSLNTTNTTVTGNVADITANASAISVLDTTVTNLDGVVSVLSGDNTSLISELKVRFRIQDESDDNLETENDVEVETESLDNLTAGVSTADQTLETLVTANDAAITSQSVFVTELSSSIDNAIVDIGTNTTAISANATAVSGLITRVTATESSITAQSSDITSLEVDLGTAETNLAANATAIGGLDTRVSSAEGTISSLSSDITSLNSSVTTANTNITANATAIGGLTTRVTTAEGSITSQAADITALSTGLTSANTNITANATAVSGVSTRVTATETSITSISTDVSTLSTTVGTNTTSISTQATSINGLEAQYTVKIDNNGRVAGFGLASNSRTSEPVSEFVVIADKFSIVNPSSTAATPIIPFQVSGSKISMTGNVEINGSLMVTGSVDTAQIATHAVTLTANAYTSGGITTASGSTAVQSVSYTSTGSEAYVMVNLGFVAGSQSGTYTIAFDVFDGTTLIHQVPSRTYANGTTGQIGFSFTYTPSAGSRTISVNVKTGAFTAFNRGITIIELKR
jgi:prefoldin subunit 5